MGSNTVLVVCPPGTTVDGYDRAVRELLAPHRVDADGYEHEFYYYDEYRGGSFFPLVTGLTPRELEQVLDVVDGYARGGPLRLLALDAMRDAAAEEARARWDRVAATFTRRPTRLWGSTRAEAERTARAEAVIAEPVVLPSGHWCSTGRLDGLMSPLRSTPPSPTDYPRDQRTHAEARRTYTDLLNAHLDGLPGDTFLVFATYYD